MRGKDWLGLGSGVEDSSELEAIWMNQVSIEMMNDRANSRLKEKCDV